MQGTLFADPSPAPAANAPASPLLALTLWLPWPWAMTRAQPLKTVENRTWPPPSRLVGKRLALHAGKHWDAAGYDFIRRLDPRCPARSAHPSAAIVAVVTVRGAVRQSDEPDVNREVIGLGMSEGTALCRSPWFFGPWGWLCTDLLVLPHPIPCLGHQGLWHVPNDIAAEIATHEAPIWRAPPPGGNPVKTCRVCLERRGAKRFPTAANVCDECVSAPARGVVERRCSCGASFRTRSGATRCAGCKRARV